MKKDKRFDKSGFTIIEVALVLALAGLILLMVFVALPTLQRSQRDAQRRENTVAFLEQLQRYQGDNRGALPLSSENWNTFLADYMSDNFKDPLGYGYVVTSTNCVAESAGDECEDDDFKDLYNSGKTFDDVLEQKEDGTKSVKLVVVRQATCSGNEAVAVSNQRKIAVLYKMEGAGDVYCNNS